MEAQTIIEPGLLRCEPRHLVRLQVHVDVEGLTFPAVCENWSGYGIGLASETGPEILAGQEIRIALTLPKLEEPAIKAAQVRWVAQNKVLRFGAKFLDRLEPHLLAALLDYKWR